MSKIDEATLGAYLNNLMRDKLGPHFDWKVPKIQNFVGPYDPLAFEKYDRRRKEVVYACQQLLAGLSDVEILVLVDNRSDDPNEIRDDWFACQRNEIHALQKMKPPWYAGGFGHPRFLADFTYWAQVPHFTYHEALFLSLGVEPTHISPDDVLGMVGSLEKGVDLWEPLRYMLRRREQVTRQFPSHSRAGRISPNELFDWFELVSLDVHPKFTSRYLTPEPSTPISPAEKETIRPHKREIDSICQLFAAMVIEYYGYDPVAARSPVPKEVTELAAAMGLEISEDTVRKYLRRGADFVPANWKPK